MCRNLIKSVGRFLFISFIAFSFSKGFAQTLPVLDWVRVNRGGQNNVNELTGKGYAIAIDVTGNVYAASRFFGTIDFDPGSGVFELTSTGAADVFVTKFDGNGNFLWAKSMGGTLQDNAYGISVDPNGNVYLTGSFNGTADFDPGAATFNLTSAGNTDIFIMKLTTAGDFVWAKSVGNSNNSEGFAIATDASGNVYTTGFFTEQTDFNPGTGVFNLDFSSGTCSNCQQIFILKLDTNGNFVWAKQGGQFGNSNGYGIAIDPSGNVLTTGYFWSGAFGAPSPGLIDIFIAKHDTNGNLLWGKAIGDPDAQDNLSVGDEKGFSITSDLSGNVYVTGRYNNAMDFDPGAGVFTMTPVNSFDVFILKLDPAGNFTWAKSIGGTSTGIVHDAGYGIKTDASGNIYTTGGFVGTVDFDPGVGVFNIDDSGLGDIFISKLDTDGNFIWAGSMSGCCGREAGGDIAVNNSGNIFTTGYYSGGGPTNPADMDPNACTFDVIDAGGMFIQKLKIGTLPDPPTFTSFTPGSGPVGTSVTLTGTNFSTTPASNAVKFFNNRTATVTTSTTTSITTTVPASSVTGKISVTVNCVTVQSATDFVIVGPPTITSFTPSNGPVGTTVTITGTNFSSTPANNTVKFNGTTATVTASTATSITTKVPVNATTGKITVTVGSNTATSTPNFTVTVPTELTITSQPANFPACPGDIATFSTSAAGTTNITYRWQIEIDAIFTDLTNGNGYSGVSTSTLTIDTNENDGIGVFRCRINGDASSQIVTNEVSITLKQNCESNEPPVIKPGTGATQVGGIVTLDLTNLISDPDDNLDASSLQLLTNVSAQGASASLTDWELVLDYNGVIFLGTDYVSIGVCDLAEACTEQELTIEVSGEVTVYNAISPNGDSKNEILIIQSIDVLPEAATNRVSIFNRWGDLVFEVKNYNNTDRVFKGIGKNGSELPAGTYYYKIEYSGKTKTGYLSLKR